MSQSLPDTVKHRNSRLPILTPQDPAFAFGNSFANALVGRTWLRAALTSQPMPIALVGLAIKLALINGTPVFVFVRVALRFLGVPLAIWIVCANELIDFGGAWNGAFVVTAFLFVIAFASDTEAGAGEQ
jgi:hypothetical protein